VREETQLEPICAVCKKLIARTFAYRIASGEKAHLACNPDSTPDEEKKPAP